LSNLYARILWLSLVLIFSVFIIVVFPWVSQNKRFNNDEFQHLHIAWCTKQGDLIYKDFFEHHGPLFPFFNVLLWRAFSLRDNIDTIMFFRFVSLLGALLLLFLTYLIGRIVYSRAAGILAAVLLSTHRMFIDKSLEIRPDVLQNIFWLGGILLFIKAYYSKRQILYFCAGLLWGLSLLTNIKAAICIAAAFIALFVFFDKEGKYTIFKLLFSGTLVPIAVMSWFFYSCGALYEFFYFNIPFNISASFVRNNQFVLFAREFVLYNPLFTVLLILGLFREGSLCFKQRHPIIRFLFFITVFLCITLLTGPYSQYYLMLLPLLSLFAAGYIVSTRFKNIKRSFLKGAISAFIILVALKFQMKAWDMNYSYFSKKDNSYQLQMIEYILRHTAESDTILTCWETPVGYTFRAHVSYYWYENEWKRRLFNRMEKTDVFGKPLIEALIKKRCRVVVASERDLRKYLPEITRSYILEHYKPVRQFPEIRIREGDFLQDE